MSVFACIVNKNNNPQKDHVWGSPKEITKVSNVTRNQDYLGSLQSENFLNCDFIVSLTVDNRYDLVKRHPNVP